MKNIKSKIAFTLAEVLITLGVLGVIAAISLPPLLNNHRQKQFEAGEKVFLSNLLRAMQNMQADDKTYFDYGYSFITVLMKYLKVDKICYGNIHEVSYTDGEVFPIEECFVEEFKTENGVVQNINSYMLPNSLNKNIKFQDFNYGFTTPNGMNAIFAFNLYCNLGNANLKDAASIPCMSIMFDVNGNAGPNKFGQDIRFLNVDRGDTSKFCNKIDCFDTTDIVQIGSTVEASSYCQSKGMRLPNMGELSFLISKDASSLAGLVTLGYNYYHYGSDDYPAGWDRTKFVVDAPCSDSYGATSGTLGTVNLTNEFECGYEDYMSDYSYSCGDGIREQERTYVMCVKGDK